MINGQRGSVTLLLQHASGGDDSAIDELLTRCLPRLLQLAQRFRRMRRMASAGSSDFAASACAKLWQGLVRNRIQTVRNREQLWRLLARLTKNEIVDHARLESATKRGGGQVLNEATLRHSLPANSIPLQRMGSRRTARSSHAEDSGMSMDTSTPSRVTEYEYLAAIECLPFDLQEIATLALLGERNHEIAQSLGCAVRTVERKIALVREHLSNPN